MRILGGAAVLGTTGIQQSIGPAAGQPRPQQDGTDPTEVSLVAAAGQAEIGPDASGETWQYSDHFPGPEIRLDEGETVRIDVDNQLSEETTVHWHGIPVPNAMDGVPNVTQEPISAGETFTYEYDASPAGTYVYHSHVGLQLDTGLSGPLIIEEDSPHVEYDREYTLMIDDFLFGRPTLDSIEAPPGGGPGGSGPGNGGPGSGPGDGGPGNRGPDEGGPGSGPGGGRGPGDGMGPEDGGGPGGGRGPGGPGGDGPGGGPGDRGPDDGGPPDGDRRGGNNPMQGQRPPYEGLVINGRLPSDPPVFDVQEGDRVRLRLIKPSSATTYRVGIGGHPLIVTHADGRPVDPIEVDSLELSMGERYDVIVEADTPGEWAIVAAPVVGTEQPAEARLRYENADEETADGPQFDGRRLQYRDLSALDPLDVDGTPDRTFQFTLSGGMMQGDPDAWTIDGQVYPEADPLAISEGEHIRVEMVNRSPAIHPMHLHGHFFQVGEAVKDTVMVPPYGGQVSFDFRADNPGDWLFHCHNVYHLERGMARVFEYV
jgi:Putative multicopper oxidases